MIIAEFDLAIQEADPAAEVDEIRFCGETFAVAAEISSLPLMRLAHALIDEGVTELQTLGMAYACLRECIAPPDWPRFEALATARKARYRDLTRIAYRIHSARAARPTVRSSDSSAGPPPTTAPSNLASSSPDSAQASDLPPGRPDLAVPMVSVGQLVGDD